MKIDLMSEIQVGSLAAGANKPVDRPAPNGAAGAGRATAKTPPNGVTVTLSAQSQSLSAAGQSSEVMDMDKVKAVQAAIANGSFSVNADAIADKLLSNAREMLSASRR